MNTTTTTAKPRILVQRMKPQGWRVRVEHGGRVVFEAYEATKRKAKTTGLLHAFEHNRGQG